jgi:2'-5' RNA ligase
MGNLTRLIIINVPPLPVVEAIERLRKPLCRKFNDSWALSYPPHVTLRTGVLVPDTEMKHFLKEFRKLIDGQGSFMIRTGRIRLKSVTFERERKTFVYLPVIKDAELDELNRRLISYTPYRKSLKRKFEPHVTFFLGNRNSNPIEKIKRQIDQNEKVFNFLCAWRCDNVSLYIQKRTTWKPFHTFSFR